jgi:hypothetical protein
LDGFRAESPPCCVRRHCPDQPGLANPGLANRARSQSDSVLLWRRLPRSEAIAERVAVLLDERQRDDGWLRGAGRIATYIDAPASRVYALAACNPPRIPVQRDGSALVARRSELDAWVRRGGGKRP